jgi:1-acyl-sn-glycerol-3-phosphate acyltransferase
MGMQTIVFEEPYRFVPPHRGTWWPSVIQWLDLYSIWLRRSNGVVGYECRNANRIRESLGAGHGILITPNHCRPSDPLVIGYLGREARCHFFAMASWHLFKQDWFTAWSIRRMGAFSIYREGVDRTAINTAIDILRTAERPLVIFPEGSVTRTNDRLHALLDGVAFIARTAAKRRERDTPGRKVVVHPVALKYLFQGDNVRHALDPVLTNIERRLSWRPQQELPLFERITKVGLALLCLKEIEYLGAPQDAPLGERLKRLTDRLLHPLEDEWLGGKEEGPVVPRVKSLRMKILPAMVRGETTRQERERRWQQLADIYLAQQVSCYLPDYLSDKPSVDRLYETVERFEEDLTDVAQVHGPLKVVLDVGEAIEVRPQRNRRAEVDPLMVEIQRRLQQMLDKLVTESPVYEEPAACACD